MSRSRPGGANPRPSFSLVAALTPRDSMSARTRAPAGVASCCRNQAAADSWILSSVSRSAVLGPLLVALLELRQRHPEALRELLHRVGKPDLVVQLEELQHVAADAAAEAVEEALVAVDVERRRLLAVERAQPLVGGAGLLERDVVADHHDDVGVVLQVVDELLREERQGEGNSSPSARPPSRRRRPDWPAPPRSAPPADAA